MVMRSLTTRNTLVHSNPGRETVIVPSPSPRFRVMPPRLFCHRLSCLTCPDHAVPYVRAMRPDCLSGLGANEVLYSLVFIGSPFIKFPFHDKQTAGHHGGG